MLHHVEIHCEESRLQRSAECVALHQADLGIGRLVAQQMLLRWDHILKDLDKKQGGAPLVRCSSKSKGRSSLYSTVANVEARDMKSLQRLRFSLGENTSHIRSAEETGTDTLGHIAE